MAKTKKEEVVESTAKQEQPTVDNEVGKIKVKKKCQLEIIYLTIKNYLVLPK